MQNGHDNKNVKDVELNTNIVIVSLNVLKIILILKQCLCDRKNIQKQYEISNQRSANTCKFFNHETF